jgi:hypothetical protein
MPGTLVRDALASNLAVGVTLNAAGTTTGTAVDISKPAEVEFELATSTVTSTGNSATLNVEIKGADDVGMSVNVVSFGRFAALTGTDAAQSNVKKYLRARVDKRYVTATAILGGTAPVYTGTTIMPVMKDLLRQAKSTSA